MKLKIKDEFKGMIVTRNHNRVGKITFDTNRVEEDRYINFFNHGFEEMFDVVDEVITEKAIITEVKIENNKIVEEVKPSNYKRTPRKKK